MNIGEHDMTVVACDDWTYSGLRTIILENDCLRVTAFPELGGKLYDLIYKPIQKNVLWHNPGSNQGGFRSALPSTMSGAVVGMRSFQMTRHALLMERNILIWVKSGPFRGITR